MANNTIQIKYPIWKTRSVGIADYKLKGKGTVRMEILYKDKQGERIYPYIYEMPIYKAVRYPTQEVKGITLHIIPIEDFIINGRAQNEN
jgi:hypothetical protein